MTNRIRIQITALTTIAATLPGRLPDPWPERISTHTATINRFVDSALANLGAAAHTPTEPDHTRPPNTDPGDRPDPTEAAAARQAGPARTAHALSTHIVTASAHIHIALDLPETRQHERCRYAWLELGNACTIVEKWQTLDRKTRNAMLCSGLHHAGFHVWGDPECPRFASVNGSGSCDLAGLCIECAAKREAWRKRIEYRDRGRADRRGAPA